MDIKIKEVKYYITIPYGTEKMQISGYVEVTDEGKGKIERAEDAIGRWLTVEQLIATAKLYTELARLAKAQLPKKKKK